MVAEGAAFDSFSDQLNAKCHPETRVRLRLQIHEWTKDPFGKCIFWLNGMAGTGKSTIVRTVAYEFASQRQLGASFFFKKGEGDRSNASRFFTTIAVQLVQSFPSLASLVQKVIETEPTISSKTMDDQFERLLLQPLSTINNLNTSVILIVIDALDECEDGSHIRRLLHLLSQMKDVKHINIRILVTSRPELPIDLGFKKLSEDAYQDVILHEIPCSIVEQDIAAFLKTELSNIRLEYNETYAPSDESLPQDWPGKDRIQSLVAMSVPLFIFAATACRYIQDNDWGWDPEGKLAAIIQSQNKATLSQLEKIYSTYSQPATYRRV